MSGENPKENLVQEIVALGLTGPANVSAIKAVKTLIFGTADYAAAWFERWTSEVRAGTAARVLISDATAKAGASHIAADVDLAERAVRTWLPQAIRNQINREKVAKDFLDELRSSEKEVEAEREISDDWMERYAEYAGKISEDDLQFVLARILVREVNAPGSVPISTLRIVAELDSQTAKSFEKYSDHVFQGKWIHYTYALGDEPNFEEILDLAAAGLIAYPDTSTVESFSFVEGEPYIIDCGDYGVSLVSSVTEELNIRSIPLTRAGRQIYKSLHVNITEGTAREVADALIPAVVRAEMLVKSVNGWGHYKSLIETIDGEGGSMPEANQDQTH